MVPPRGMVAPATMSRFSSSFTRFFGRMARGTSQFSVVRSSWMKPLATCSASPVSICAPAEPEAPKASRANCRRAEACRALLAMRSSANSRMLGSLSSSSTSIPLTMAPTGLMTSWHTREHSSAARSRLSRSMAVVIGSLSKTWARSSGANRAKGAAGTRLVIHRRHRQSNSAAPAAAEPTHAP